MKRYKYPTINTDTYRMNIGKEEGMERRIGRKRIGRGDGSYDWEGNDRMIGKDKKG